jgi:hypothetical protein
LGHIHWDSNSSTYFGLWGTQIAHDGSAASWQAIQGTMQADVTAMFGMAVGNALSSFWESYGGIISFGGDLVDVVSLFRNVPGPVGLIANIPPSLNLMFGAESLLTGQASARQYADAIMIIVALRGGKPGVIAALSYTAGMTTYDAGVALHETVQRTGQDIRTLNRNTEQRMRSGRSPFFNLPMGF